MSDLERLANARRALAELRAALRAAERALADEKLRAEQAAIDSANGPYGRNAEERERFLALALQRSEPYQRALRAAEQLRQRVELAQTELEILLDAERDRRLRLAERMIRVYEETPAGLGLAFEDGGAA